MADLSLNFNRDAMARRLGAGGSSLDCTTAMRAFLNTAHAANAARKDLNTEFLIRSRYAAAVLADSPVGYWRLGDTSPFADTGSGNKAATGTVTTGVTGPMYDANAAITLSGAQSASTAATDPFAAATACSIECWIKSNGAWSVGSTNVIVNASNVGHYLGLNTSAAAFGSLIISGVQRTVNHLTIAVPTTGWHHVVLTWASGDPLRLYVDGVLLTASSAFAGTLDAGTGGVCLGAFNTAAPSLFYTGSLDEAAIYTSQLSAMQVATHYAGR